MHAYHHNIKINLIETNPDECNQGLCFYAIAANSNKCNGDCSTLCCLSDKIYVLSKTESLNSNFFYYDKRNKLIKKIKKT